jgi:UDP-glucose 4-epimerase
MNILVTGGAGFVGTNLIRRLLSDNHSVISIDNYFTGLKSNHIEGAIYLEMDIVNMRDTDFEKLLSDYGNIDYVFHLAAVARIQPSFKNPIHSFEANSLGTFNVAIFCSKNNIPLIYAGSSSHHGGRFRNPYTFSKDVGEECIILCSEIYNLKFNIARFYNVYGPNHLKEGDYSTLIGKWENRIENNLPLIIYGDGKKRRDFTHIDDIVDALILMISCDVWGITFELGRGKNYSVKEIADAFNQPIEYEPNREGEVDVTLCDNDIAKKLLGWNPKKDVIEYIKFTQNK